MKTKIAGAKTVNTVLSSLSGAGRHDMKRGFKRAKRAKQNASFRREMKDE